MKFDKNTNSYQITSFISTQDDEGHYNLEGDLEIDGIV